jgi:acetyl-CoA C-acetyltransferase
MIFDGLEDSYNPKPDGSRRAMGVFADETAKRYNFSRQQQEEFVAQSFENYIEAEKEKRFANERITLNWTDPKGNLITINQDEPPTRVKPEKFSLLKPAFTKDGTVTAATSSPLTDGAAAIYLSSESSLGNEKPIAKVTGYTSHGIAPEWFTLAPIGAIESLLKQVQWKIEDVDLFEINEAFAVVPMAVMQDLKIPRSKVNIFGGACCLGHPIGASGSRIIVTLIHALRSKGLKRGIASVCIGGGEGTAVAIETCD